MTTEVTMEHEALLGGRYLLLRLLAKGGMGTVYAAETMPEGRKVAVKLLNESAVNNPKAAQRLYTEAHAASAVGHPNIVEVFELGQTYNGTPFLVMELLEGQSLADVLHLFGKLEPAYAIGIVAQVLSALDAAHEKGIIHRDLKPQNVFLCYSEAGQTKVKILDFGISKTWDDDQQLHLTQTGFVVGTPYYMSPEHARGAKDVDGQTDIWAVGVVLYQCITGRLPYEGETYNELLAKILNEPFPAPRQVAPQVSAALERVMLKALAKDRTERYETAAQFRKELLSVPKLFADAGDEPPARPVAVEPRPAAQSWRSVLVASAVVASLVAGTITGIALFGDGDRSIVDDIGKRSDRAGPTPLPAAAAPASAVQPDSAPNSATPPQTQLAETVELAVRVRPEVERTTVVVNGQDIGGDMVQVTPGVENMIVISSPGYQPAQVRRAIAQDTVIEVQMIPVRRASGERRARSATTEPRRRGAPARAEPNVPLRHRPIEIVEEYPQ